MSNSSKDNKSKSIWDRLKQGALEWGGILAVLGALYLTGWHTEVIGTLQRTLLWTGIFDAEATELSNYSGPDLTARDYTFALEEAGGKQFQLDDLKGQVLFINFWASWCPPCVAEMPTIQDLHEQTARHENIRFLMISLDQKREDAHNFMNRKSFDFTYHFPVSPLPSVFEHQYIPTTFIVSKSGEIVYKKSGIADYSSDQFTNWMLQLADE